MRLFFSKLQKKCEGLKFTMENYNAAIYMLSSRKHNLFNCLQSLYEKWNYQYDYPVYVHYFDNIYDDKKFQDNIKRISPKIYFIKVNYQIPAFIDYKDLFFNRKYLNYVKNSFSVDRVGYLHMEYFVSDIYNFGQVGLASAELKKYDFLMRIDDDIVFQKNINYDLFGASAGFPISSGFTWSSSAEELRSNNQQIEVRENLFSFIKKYIKEYDIQILNQDLLKAINENKETLMHTLTWSAGNLNIYDMSYFNNDIFKNYISQVNKFGGAYKHRWGDQEVLGLYNYIHYDIPLNDLGLLADNSYNPRIEGSNFAPSTSNNLFFKLKKNFYSTIKKSG